MLTAFCNKLADKFSWLIYSRFQPTMSVFLGFADKLMIYDELQFPKILLKELFITLHV